MEYVIGIVIVLGYFIFSVNGDLNEKRILKYLAKNDLAYRNHSLIHQTKEIKKQFKEDVNPFLWIIYNVQYYNVKAVNAENEMIDINVKWYKRMVPFLKSKAVFQIGDKEMLLNKKASKS